jgi:hypothetical protein
LPGLERSLTVRGVGLSLSVDCAKLGLIFVTTIAQPTNIAANRANLVVAIDFIFVIALILLITNEPRQIFHQSQKF